MSDYNANKNRAVWFDIPVADLDQAVAEGIMSAELHPFRAALMRGM